MMKSKTLLVIPPVTLLQSPSLGVHILQAYSKSKGFDVDVLYADQLFAKSIGVENYDLLNEQLMSPYEQVAERLFARIAYNNTLPFMGNNTDQKGIINKPERSDLTIDESLWNHLLTFADKIDEWVRQTTEIILSKKPNIVGVSTSHQQTNASIALINSIKASDPSVTTIIGGSNCDGNMGEGILSLSKNIDYVFSGESELSFVQFLEDFEQENLAHYSQIIKAVKLKKLDDIPTPIYREYFDQLKANQLEDVISKVWLNYETSRGCWWGVSNLCTFCGVNGSDTKFRLKSAPKVIEEIQFYKDEYNLKNLRMVDTLMPGSYFRTLLPHFPEDFKFNIFYEMRADITLEQMYLLKNTGVNYMQIGIEAFTTKILQHINKGVQAYENVNVLRFARVLGNTIGWNLLLEVPGDSIEDWEETLRIIPYLRHLDPPSNFRPVELARFSPYYESYQKYDIQNLKPFDVYYDIFPAQSDFKNLAWLFYGDYDCSSKDDLDVINKIKTEIGIWQELWIQEDDLPVLEIEIVDELDSIILMDTRKIPNLKKLHQLNSEQMSVCLLGDESIYFEKYADWALENMLVLEVDGKTIPLVTSDYSKIIEIKENEKKVQCRC